MPVRQRSQRPAGDHASDTDARYQPGGSRRAAASAARRGYSASQVSEGLSRHVPVTVSRSAAAGLRRRRVTVTLTSPACQTVCQWAADIQAAGETVEFHCRIQ